MVRRIALGAVLATLLFAVPAGATVVPPLGSLTTVHVTDAGWTPVVLPQPLRLDLNDEVQQPHAKLTGKTVPRGFVLRHDGDAKEEPGLMGFAFFEDQPGLFIDSLAEVPEANIQDDHYYIDLPAGEYRLYVYGSGPATLELSIAGLGPALDLTADQPSSFHVADTPRLDGFATTNSAAFGMGVDLSSKGFLYTSLDSETELLLTSRVEPCEYSPGHDFTGSDAFTTGCPGSDEESGSVPAPDYIAIPPGAGGSGAAIIDAAAPAGRYGLGGNVTQLGLPPDLAAKTAWLSYGPPGLPAGYTLAAAKAKHKKCTAKRKRAHKCGAKRKRRR
jgi:hypothetical protein